MCSISGIVSPNINTKKLISSMIAIQSHRAPDESGIFRDQYLSIGMGRLKIIDLKTKNLTPFYDKNFVLAYNGEIFNYIELRNELKALGVKFRSDTDTEVLFESWKRWGTKTFKKLNGMYAFCIYDIRKKKIYLARDIAGEKPLYYFLSKKNFFFSSEAKALFSLKKKKIKKDEFYNSFQYCFDDTIFEDIKQLKPACYAEYDISTAKLSIKEHWEFKKRKIYKNDLLEELEFLIKDSIKIRNRSDVKLGLYYSKGLDSSLLRLLGNYRNLIFFDDKKNYIKDFNKNLKKIAYHLDFPVGSLSSYPLYKLAKKAKQKNIKVILSGEGADEVFGGYVRHIPIAKLYYMKKRFPSYKPMFEKINSSYSDIYAKLICRDKNYNFVSKKISKYFELFEDPINAMGFIDFKFIMPSLLQMGDRMSSAYSLENRCPFLDKRIIEFGFSLEPEMKIDNFKQKKLLFDLFDKRNKKFKIIKEKKGLSFNYNTWYNSKDQKRKKYFLLLNKTWKKCFNL